MDRKEAIRAYKDTPRPMGVFVVRDRSSDVYHLGTSIDLPSMLNRVRFQLDMGSHPHRTLQQAWNRTGGESFEIAVLDTLEPSEDPGYDPTDDLAELLAMWEERITGTFTG